MAKAVVLMFLRVSLGWLLVIWGVNRLVHVEHGLAVANGYYAGFLAVDTLMPLAGAAQVLIGLLVVVGLGRRWTYPLQVLMNGASLVAVSASVVDPWGWLFEGTNMLFYPSLIIFAASLAVMAFRDQDRLALDARLGRRRGCHEWPAPRRCRGQY